MMKRTDISNMLGPKMISISTDNHISSDLLQESLSLAFIASIYRKQNDLVINSRSG